MSWYETCRAYYFCLDPVHVGAGGYRLGRVDNSIVREPGTRVPKVPGTSLSGAARSYAAMLAGRIDAAGTQAGLTGKKDYLKCPILYTFGTASDDVEKGPSKAGAVSFGDAQILLFPVYSARGPIWVTTPELLEETGLAWEGESPTDAGTIVAFLGNPPSQLNVGWLLFSKIVPGKWVANAKHQLANSKRWKAVADRVVVVSPSLFSVIVNANLEVRTSVSINPKTGAAEEHLLFTYEALPRGTWLFSDVVVDDFTRKFPGAAAWSGPRNPECEKWTKPLDVALSGLKLIEHLGVGGMGTRGFGRMALLDGGAQ